MDDNRKPAILRYNVVWMDRVFRSRYKIEDLMTPEKEAGNISPRDYDAALHFLPDNHRYYPILCSLGLSSLVLLRPVNATWTRGRQGMAAFSIGFLGFNVGKFMLLNAHYNFVRSLENPGGFDRAMENVKTKIGTHVPEGFIIERKYDPTITDNIYDAQIPEHESRIMLPTTVDSSASPSTTQTSPSPKPLSRWDQIRNANNRAASTSSWDQLRQKHEKEAVSAQNSDGEVRWDETA